MHPSRSSIASPGGPPVALTVAGSDSGGGAGIQADLKTFTALGVYGASVITALTAQNTVEVAAIHAPEPDFVVLQLEAVLDDMDVAAVKTGMLFSAPIIHALADALADRDALPPMVVDPVCVAQSGARLLRPDAEKAIVERIFPLAALLTPNRPEAELFTGMSITTESDVRRALAKLLDMGPKAVLLKGGHGPEEDRVTDWLGLPGREPLPLSQPRVDTLSLHGTGCTLSAAIASYLARGESLENAVRMAQQFLNRALRESFAVGRGAGPVNHMAGLRPWQDA